MQENCCNALSWYFALSGLCMCFLFKFTRVAGAMVYKTNKRGRGAWGPENSSHRSLRSDLPGTTSSRSHLSWSLPVSQSLGKKKKREKPVQEGAANLSPQVLSVLSILFPRSPTSSFLLAPLGTLDRPIQRKGPDGWIAGIAWNGGGGGWREFKNQVDRCSLWS